MNKEKRVGVVIVIHNSQKYIYKNLECLKAGNYWPNYIIIVDSGSEENDYEKIKKIYPDIKIINAGGNIGFAAANNLGYKEIRNKVDYILFLNPDAFIINNTLEIAIDFMNKNRDIGILTGKLLGFNIETNEPTKLLDSTGVFYNAYGRFYDRGQGEIDKGQYDGIIDIPAACGAFLFCRVEALEKSLLYNEQVFDERYFMYKEDIDLCIRVKNADFRIVYSSEVAVYHCRGWNNKRNKMPYWARLLSLKNDWRIYQRNYLPISQQRKFFIYLLAKSAYVLFWERLRSFK